MIIFGDSHLSEILASLKIDEMQKLSNIIDFYPEEID
jgi:hypothetical protein